MNCREQKAERGGERRFRLLAIVGLVFALAQILFAAHVGAATDDLADHTKQACEICLAGALSTDPHDLGVEVSTPVVSYAAVARPVAADIIVAKSLIAANPRGPPVL